MNENLKKGDRIRLLKMPNDPDPLPVGATGTVELILNPDSRWEQVHVKWDPPNEHRILALLPKVDEFEVLPQAPRFAEIADKIRKDLEPWGFRIHVNSNRRTITIREE